MFVCFPYPSYKREKSLSRRLFFATSSFGLFPWLVSAFCKAHCLLYTTPTAQFNVVNTFGLWQGDETFTIALEWNLVCFPPVFHVTTFSRLRLYFLHNPFPSLQQGFQNSPQKYLKWFLGVHTFICTDKRWSNSNIGIFYWCLYVKRPRQYTKKHQTHSASWTSLFHTPPWQSIMKLALRLLLSSTIALVSYLLGDRDGLSQPYNG